MSIRTTVDLAFSFAVLHVPEKQEQRFAAQGVDVTVDQQTVGKDRKLIVTLHDELLGLKEFNHAWLTHDGQVFNGVARMPRPDLLEITLFHDQPDFA